MSMVNPELLPGRPSSSEAHLLTWYLHLVTPNAFAGPSHSPATVPPAPSLLPLTSIITITVVA